uniref:Uncharacterized protein n=1 Tax=Anguilla anguilla TaxID=7936 RepID=A0A0E9R1N4_ANGAN
MKLISFMVHRMWSLTPGLLDFVGLILFN